MPTPSCSDVSLDNDAKPDGNSYAYCLAAEIRALKTKNLQLRQVSEGGTGANNAASAIENLTGAALATVGQVLTKDVSGVIWSTPASGGEGGGDVTGPASSINGNIPIFDGLTGKVLMDSDYHLPPGDIADVDSPQTLTNKTLGSGTTYAGTRIPVAYGGVPDPAPASEGQVLTRVSGVPAWSTPSGAGIGDVTGPASSTDNVLAVYNGTTGKLLKNSTVPADDIARINATQTLTYKTLGGACVWAGAAIDEIYGGTGITTYTPGDMLYSSSPNNLGKLPIGAAGQVLTVISGAPAWASAAGAGLGDVSGPASAVANNFATFDGTTGKLIKDSGKAAPLGAFVGTTDTQTLTNKTFGSGSVWNGTDIAIADGGTGASTAQAAINNLTAVSAATAGHVLTKVGSDAIWAVATGGSSVSTPFYIDRPPVGSNITYYSGQDPVASYSHSAYQNALRVIHNAADYTGTPTTYTHLGQLDANTVAYKTYAGYQQNLTTDSGGRTLSSAYKARVEHNAMGDVNGFFATVSVNGHSNMAGVSGNWTGGPSGTVCGGEVYANAPKVNVYGQEFQLYSNGQDNTTGIGAVYGLYRDSAVAAYNNAWVGIRTQSDGSTYSDVAYQVANKFKVGFDATSMILDANKAVATIPAGGRIYIGCPATVWPAIVPTVTGPYLDTQGTKTRSSVPFGVVSSQPALVKMDTGDAALSVVSGTAGAIKIDVEGAVRYIPYSDTPTFASAGGSASGNLLSVLDYGATGNGSTDDTTAIQNCINACFSTGKNMLVPAGTYLVTSLTMSSDIYANHFSVFGEGRNKTIIRKYTTSSTPVLTIGDGTPAIFQANITIEGITFDGLNTTSAAAVRTYDMVRSSFKDCIFMRANVGFAFNGGVANQFYNCMFDACNYGVFMQWVTGMVSQPNETLFNGCQFVNNPLWGLYFIHGALCVLDSCEVEGNGTTGNAATGGLYAGSLETLAPALINSQGIIAQNCWFEANAGRASCYFADGRNTIRDSYFIANPNSTYEIYVSGGTYVVDNCSFQNAKTHHLYETAGAGTGNYINAITGSVSFTKSIDSAKTKVDYNSGGPVQRGYGATAGGTGLLTVTFTTPFSTIPNVQCQIVNNDTTQLIMSEVYNVSTTGFTVRTKAITSGSATVYGLAAGVYWSAAEWY
jgi:hypothetical protein